mgnify:CR=1 FL=1
MGPAPPRAPTSDDIANKVQENPWNRLIGEYYLVVPRSLHRFREQGFPAMGISEEYVSGDTTPHDHLGSDTFETVDLGYLVSLTTALTGYLYDLVAP